MSLIRSGFRSLRRPRSYIIRQLLTAPAAATDHHTKQLGNFKSRLAWWMGEHHLKEGSFSGRVVSGRKDDDLEALVHNFTSPALARALRDREDTLAQCADALRMGHTTRLRELLSPFEVVPVVGMGERSDVAPASAAALAQGVDPGGVFDQTILNRLTQRLNRMPREISKRGFKRASVVLPLCLVDGLPSVLFTLRSETVGSHKGEVCFPGGLVDRSDLTIQQCALRELEEECGIRSERVEVLGTLRCDWSEVTSITGVAVTPIIGYLGDLENLALSINANEVQKAFSVSVTELLDPHKWRQGDEFTTPVFRPDGQPVVWGLTAYILERFLRLLTSTILDNQLDIESGVNVR